MDDKTYDVGEFISYEISEGKGHFTITITGDLKYKLLLANKLNEIRISENDLREFCLDE